MKRDTRGHSLIELLIAIVITLGIGLVIFQLFHQNERVFRDQHLMIEMQQAARVAVSEIADTIRLAGQGVPVYSSTYDELPSEATAAILPGSGSDRIYLRAGLSNTESDVTATIPLNLALGTPASLTLRSASAFSDFLGTTPAGRYVYLWGPIAGARWTWVRASVGSISAVTHTIQITPVQGGAPTVRFTAPATISAEEGIAIFRDPVTHTIKRTTAVNMSNPVSPIWAAAQELVTNVTSLTLTYHDVSGNVIRPDTLANRMSVARVDVRVVIATSERLSNGTLPTYALSMTSVPRNIRIR